MPTRDPSTYAIATYVWVIGLSLWGGLVSYARKVKTQTIPRYSILEFIGEMATSGFIGVVTFFLCEFAQLDRLVTAAMVGISGHAGSRAIFQVESFLRDRQTLNMIPEPDKDKDDK
ncbi:MAG: hypothetical protein GQ468_00895 [Candidatus Scalindua sp.]|nr:hypothetical protein [Candidatus Scalindua sp.]